MENKEKMSWLRGSCVGRGAYGTVNIGADLSTGDVFAVKSVGLASALPSQVQALENEIRVLKSLSSPFIVRYIGDDTTVEGSPATSFRNLHMEYLPAGTVADLATGNSDEASVANYTWCLVSALSYLHSRGIMHCDVKGKNVLLGPSTGSARLADFGSAVEITSEASLSARGSPLWMAPEVIRGEHQGIESDVWSLGCTVIEMLMGKPAWGAEAYSVYRIGYSDELPLFPARLSSSGIDFLEKCLRRDYTKRWSCDQLLHHPFLSMRSQKNTASYSSPRCVLDWFSPDFHDDEEQEEEEILNVEADRRIRELASGAGANWESDGWVVVRGEAPPDGEDSAPAGSMNSNLNLVRSPENDVVAKHLYSRYSHVKKLYERSNYSVASDICIFGSLIYLFFTQSMNFISFMIFHLKFELDLILDRNIWDFTKRFLKADTIKQLHVKDHKIFMPNDPISHLGHSIPFQIQVTTHGLEY